MTLLLSAGVLVYLTRPSAVAVYDPWALQQIQTAFASAAVFFMWYAGVIQASLAAYHGAAIGAFLICASVTFRKMSRRPYVERAVYRRPLAMMRGLTFLIFLGAQVGAWAISGIPILLESRLNAFAAGGGIGIFSRVISYTSVAVIVLTVLRVGTAGNKRLSFLDVGVLLFSIASSVLNGSKTNILLTLLVILVANHIFSRTFSNYAPPVVSKKKIALLGLVLALLILVPVALERAAGGEDELEGAFAALLIRLVFSGDGYMWMYGDDYLSRISVSSPTALLFSDLLGMSRVVAWERLPIHPGLQVYRDLFPFSEAIRGPNVRVDTFGLLFGNMAVGIIFSAALGIAFGLARAWLFKVRSAVFYFPALYLFIHAPSFLVDPVLGVTALVNCCFGMIITALLIVIMGADPLGRAVRSGVAKSKYPIRNASK